MLKLFRKIRQKLLSESKFSKYVLYALGEIILVVIGILIALNINNRNDINKQRDLEVKILKEISNNLNFDLYEIREDISLMDSISKASDEVSAHLKTQNISSKQFNYNIAILKVAPHFSPNKSGYELLSSKGVEIVSNDSLRIAISDLYESFYPYYEEYEQERIEFKLNNIQPFFLKYFNWIYDETYFFKSSNQITEGDYNKLKGDELFLKLVNAIDFENSFVQLRAKSIEEKIIKLKALIEEELNKKK